MSTPEREIKFEGIVYASQYDDAAPGKQFLGAIVQCSDGKRWVVDYAEQSPFHLFAGRRVLVSGKPYTPTGQHLISVDGSLRHLKVSTMRLLDVAPDAHFLEVGSERQLSGRFELRDGGTGQSGLRFVTDEGNSFAVVNNPIGAEIGARVDVRAFPISLSASAPDATEQSLWITCPYSAAQLWEWRKRNSAGPGGIV